MRILLKFPVLFFKLPVLLLKFPVIFFKLSVIFFKLSVIFFKLPVIFFKFPVIFFKFAPQNVGGGLGELEIPPGFPLSTRLAPHFPVIFFLQSPAPAKKCPVSWKQGPISAAREVVFWKFFGNFAQLLENEYE